MKKYHKQEFRNLKLGGSYISIEVRKIFKNSELRTQNLSEKINKGIPSFLRKSKQKDNTNSP